MENFETNFIESIETRVYELQKSRVELQEQIKILHHDFDRYANNSALRVIDLLDMLEATQENPGLVSSSNANTEKIIYKIQRRLLDILRQWGITEILLTDQKVEPGKTRVIETRQSSSEIIAGTIIQVCRKGYQRGDKIIRPTDVISAL